jgi:hypothetical protein
MGRQRAADAAEAIDEPVDEAPPAAPKNLDGKNGRAISRWTTHLRAQIRYMNHAVEGTSPTEPRRDPAVENAPPLSLEPTTTAKVRSNAQSTSGKHIDLAQFVTMSDGEQLRSKWPHGPFTPEEQLYRAQYGWMAFFNAKSDEAMQTDAE